MGELEEKPAETIIRRNRRGSKRSEWAGWVDQAFNEMESIHAAQMIIQQRIRHSRLSIDHILDRPAGADEECGSFFFNFLKNLFVIFYLILN